MIYLFYDEKNQILHLRDNITSLHNRFSFDIINNQILKDSRVYEFLFKENKLSIRTIRFPIDKTVVCYI